VAGGLQYIMNAVLVAFDARYAIGDINSFSLGQRVLLPATPIMFSIYSKSSTPKLRLLHDLSCLGWR
jgi:hypothetical protein